MTRDGKTSPLRAAKAEWSNPRFSPDGRKLAIQIFDGKQSDIWVYEWARDALAQLTFDAADDEHPIWTPDGRRITFSSDRAKRGVSNLYWLNADGTGEATRLTDNPSSREMPWSWHPSGSHLVYYASREGQADVMILPMEGDAARGWAPGKPAVLLGTQASEAAPMFSHDGRWLAYASTEANSTGDVYVRPFPGPGGTWRVSTAGGTSPRWSAAAHELLFLTPGGLANVMVAPYAVAGEAFRAETPHQWAPAAVKGTTPNSVSDFYDLHPDGRRVAVASVQDRERATQDKVVFVFNFADYLRTLAPGTK